MRAQNAEPETAVRLVRGAVDGSEDPLIPGAWVVERVDEKAVAEGRVWPQSRGSQLVGHTVGSLPGERTLEPPKRPPQRQLGRGFCIWRETGRALPGRPGWEVGPAGEQAASSVDRVDGASG